MAVESRQVQINTLTTNTLTAIDKLKNIDAMLQVAHNTGNIYGKDGRVAVDMVLKECRKQLADLGGVLSNYSETE